MDKVHHNQLSNSVDDILTQATITLSENSASTMVNRILEYALNDGGLSHESEIQQTKLQLEGLPK